MATCKSKSGCDKPTIALGYCISHYRKYMRNGDPDEPIREQGLVPLPRIRVIPEVEKAMQSRAKEFDISVYELERRIIYNWYRNDKDVQRQQEVIAKHPSIRRREDE